MLFRTPILCGFAVLFFIPIVQCAEPDFQYFDANGTRLGYSIEGSGPSVILVHGLMIDSEINWRARGMTELLAENFQVISLDMRGHGRSDKPHEITRYGVEIVHDVVRLMDHLKIGSSHIVGYSSGGEVALKLTLTQPGRVKSAVVGGTGWLRDSGPSYQSYLRVSERLSAMEAGDQIVSGSFGDGNYTSTEIDAMNENDPLALAAFAGSALELSVSEDSLKDNEVPTLAIYGEIDAYRTDIELLIQRLSNVTAVRIPGTDHDGTIGATEFRIAVNDWLIEQESSDR
jgi:pimeloyl-ACP methyl ester carboxylesterase